MIEDQTQDIEDQRPPRVSRRPGFWISLALVLVFGIFLLGRTNYTLEAPGGATPIDAVLEVPEDLEYPYKGEFLLTTVNLRPATRAEVFIAWIRPGTDVISNDIFGKENRKARRQEDLQAFDESQLTAEVVALRRLGKDVTAKGKGARVVEVGTDVPADGVLETGDVITAVDDRQVGLSDELTTAIRSHKPGETVELTIVRDSKEEKVRIKLATHPQSAGAGYLGVSASTHEPEFDPPFEVSSRRSDIGGPSGGLAFTLGLIDVLSPGDMTGGQIVGVTGTMSIDGTVGEVGGVRHKVAVSKREGATLMLVSPGDFEEALRAAGDDMTVVEVATLEEALVALRDHGGDLSGIPPAPTPG